VLERRREEMRAVIDAMRQVRRSQPHIASHATNAHLPACARPISRSDDLQEPS